jgi:hypothetical protein
MKLWQIVQAIEDAETIVAEHYDNVSDVIFRTAAGWRFEVFMDCGEPDYMHWIEAPDGQRFEFNFDRSPWGFIASNLVELLGDRLIAAVRQLPNWDYK